MNTKMARLEQVDRLLNPVDELPLGHPDRLKFLAYAEEIIAGAVPETEAGAAAQMNRPRSVVVPQGRSKAYEGLGVCSERHPFKQARLPGRHQTSGNEHLTPTGRLWMACPSRCLLARTPPVSASGNDAWTRKPGGGASNGRTLAPSGRPHHVVGATTD
jgi:hypothetical protein